LNPVEITAGQRKIKQPWVLHALGKHTQHQAQCRVGSLIYFESRNKRKLQQDKKPHLLGKKTTTSRETQKHIRLYFFNLGKGIQSSEKGFCNLKTSLP
jgi:hypothetical protein